MNANRMIVGFALTSTVVVMIARAEAIGDLSGESDERVIINAEEGQTLDQTGVISLADGVVIEKTGAGTLNLPLEKVAQAGAFQMAVHAGQ